MGSAVSSPKGSGQSPHRNRIWCILATSQSLRAPHIFSRDGGDIRGIKGIERKGKGKKREGRGERGLIKEGMSRRLVDTRSQNAAGAWSILTISSDNIDIGYCYLWVIRGCCYYY